MTVTFIIPELLSKLEQLEKLEKLEKPEILEKLEKLAKPEIREILEHLEDHQLQNSGKSAFQWSSSNRNTRRYSNSGGPPTPNNDWKKSTEELPV